MSAVVPSCTSRIAFSAREFWRDLLGTPVRLDAWASWTPFSNSADHTSSLSVLTTRGNRGFRSSREPA